MAISVVPASLLVVLLAATGIVLALNASNGPGASQLQIRAGGSLTQSNSLDGLAIFTASNMGPGDSTEGMVTIGDTGTLPGSLSLTLTSLSDSPGTHGGTLSGALDLRITDITSGLGAPVYAGKLSGMPELEMATLQPGEERTYQFRVELPDNGAPAANSAEDNRYQSATASAGYLWDLAETTGDVGTPSATIGPGPRCGERLIGNARRNTLIGTSTGETIAGRGGRDLLRGAEGDDCVLGGSGADQAYGDAGNDVVRGGSGPDRLFGGSGSDVVWSRDRNQDVVDCGDGADTAVVDRFDRVVGCEKETAG